MTKETAESKILKARVRLLLSQPFFGNLLLYLEPGKERDGDAYHGYGRRPSFL